MRLLMCVWFVVGSVLEICHSNELTDNDSNFLNSSCIEPGYETPCSGHGICLDGYCYCDSLEEIDPFYKYTGKYCEECPYCKGQRCQNIYNCLQCHNNSICDDTCHLIKTSVNNGSVDEKSCLIEDENGCFASFKYHYANRELIIVGNYQRDCYNGYSMLLYVFVAVNVYIVSLFALIHCFCDRCPQKKKLSRGRSHADIVRIPTSLPEN